MKSIPTFEEYVRAAEGCGVGEALMLHDPRIKQLEGKYKKMVRGNWFRRPLKNIDFLVKGWFEPNLSWKDYDKLDIVQRNEYHEAGDILLEAIYRGNMDYRHLKGKVLNVEYGRGGSNFLLSLYDGNVHACGASFHDYMFFNNNGIENDVQASYDDNILLHMADHPENYDLITAFDLNCYRRPEPLFSENPADFLTIFCYACNAALKPEGRLIVSSSLLEMDSVRQVFGIELHHGDNPGYIVAGKEKKDE